MSWGDVGTEQGRGEFERGNLRAGLSEGEFGRVGLRGELRRVGLRRGEFRRGDKERDERERNDRGRCELGRSKLADRVAGKWRFWER